MMRTEIFWLKTKRFNKMTNASQTLLESLKLCSDMIHRYSESELIYKSQPNKWSKKEILGHLVDSALNNLKRFTEVKFQSKPYKIISYNQNELVKANKYQTKNTEDILTLLLSLNQQILFVISNYSDEELQYQIELPNEKIVNLEFWVYDYVEHFSHHLNQISS